MVSVRSGAVAPCERRHVAAGTVPANTLPALPIRLNACQPLDKCFAMELKDDFGVYMHQTGARMVGASRNVTARSALGPALALRVATLLRTQNIHIKHVARLQLESSGVAAAGGRRTKCQREVKKGTARRAAGGTGKDEQSHP